MRVAQSQVHVEWRESRAARVGASGALSARSKAVVAAAVGVAGGLGLAVPIVLYGCFNAGHSALELPMAATAWLFGLGHFAQNGYQWGSIVVGILLLAVYTVAHGAVFDAVADRFAVSADAVRDSRSRTRLGLRQLAVLLVHAAADRPWWCSVPCGCSIEPVRRPDLGLPGRFRGVRHRDVVRIPRPASHLRERP